MSDHERFGPEAGGPLAPPPFVGRLPERQLLGYLLAEARRGTAASALISGPAGIGKSALLRWVRQQVAGVGGVALTATGAGRPTGRPLVALGQLLRPFPELAAELGPGATSGGMAMDRLAASVGQALLSRSRWSFTAILVDDADQLDAASQAFLADLIQAIEDPFDGSTCSLLVVLSAGEESLDAPAVGALLGSGTCRVLPLSPFDEGEVFELVTAAGRPASRASIRALSQSSGGLPLLLDAALATGWPAGADRLAGGPHPGSSRGGSPMITDPRLTAIRQALTRQLDELDEQDCRLLAVGAVLGEPFDVAEMADVMACPVATVARALDRATGIGLVEGERGDQRLTHPLARDLLRALLDVDERRRLQARAAARLIEALTGPGARAAEDGDGDGGWMALRAAHHLIAAGPEARSADVSRWASRAGRFALARGLWGDAATLLAAAATAAMGGDANTSPAADIDLTRGAGTDDAAALFLDAATAAYFDHDAQHCELWGARALATARLDGHRTRAVEAALLLGRCRVGLAGIDVALPTALADLEETVGHEGVAPDVAVEGIAFLAEARFGRGEDDAATAAVVRARGFRGEDPVRQDRALGRVEVAEGLHRLSALDLLAAGDAFAQAESLAASAGDDLTRIAARSRQALVALVRGQVRQARDDLTEQEHEALERSLWGEAGFAAAAGAFAAILDGGEITGSVVDRSLRLARRGAHPYAWALARPAALSLESRRRPAAIDRRAAGRAGRSGRLEWSAGIPSVYEALMAAEAGDVDRARAVVARAGWRHGLRARLDLGSMAIPVALIEVGDLLEQPALVALGAEALAVADDVGVVLALGWPALVPRLLATAARHAGELEAAESRARQAIGVAGREGLGAELARSSVELAQVVSAAGGPGAEVDALLRLAAGEMAARSLHGSLVRLDAVAERVGRVRVPGDRGATRVRTILTTDVVQSTATNARLGDELYLEQLRVHDQLVRARVAEFGGLEIKHTGDGINAVFAVASNAVRATLALQVDLADWVSGQPDLALAVRCGVATGTLVPHHGDFFGLAQAEAARLCAVAPAGGVALAAEAMAALDAEVTVGWDVTPVGPLRLKGLPEPVEVVELTRRAPAAVSARADEPR